MIFQSGLLCLANHFRRQSFSKSPEAEQFPRKLSRQPAIAQVNTLPPIRAEKPAVKDYAELKGPSLLKKTLGLQNHRHSRYLGATTELEPYVIRLATFDRKEEAIFGRDTVRRVTDRDLFLMQPDEYTPEYQGEVDDLDAIESVVAPYGQELVNLYFRIVHPSFPILHKRVYLEKYSRTYREFSPPLLAAVYILALNWWSYSSHLSHLPKPDVKLLEQLALKTIGTVIQRPKLSTVQAGLLLLQRPESDSWSLTAQLMVVGHGLGLHLDCSHWKIPQWEQGLRRRLAWGLYMQDKWGSLIYGRPSQIYDSNWAVRNVSEHDFPENATDEDEEEGSTEVNKGMILFTQMIALTRILSEILDTFYSLRAMQEVEKEGGNGTQLILEKAKPIQIKLREWFTTLPDCLRIDSTKVMKLSSTGICSLLLLLQLETNSLTGYLHLAYYATEITLHRCIIRSLSPTPSISSSLHNICRSAAKARLVSAIDFVYRLRPEHLQSFWYFSSKVNLAIIGSFGCLLWATADSKDEVDFYKTKLSEYKWTLRVSSKGVEFMGFAMGVIDASMSLLTEQLGKDGRKTSETLTLEISQASAQQIYDRAEEDAVIQNYAQDTNNRTMNNFPQLGDEYDPTMDFQGLLSGQDMQVSPSATMSADISTDESVVDGSNFYANDAGGTHESFDFLPRPGLWMSGNLGSNLVNDQWPG